MHSDLVSENRRLLTFLNLCDLAPPVHFLITLLFRSQVIALVFYVPSVVLSTDFLFSLFFLLQAQYVLISPEVSNQKTNY